MERLQWAGYHLAQNLPLFLLLENWSVNIEKFQKSHYLSDGYGDMILRE